MSIRGRIFDLSRHDTNVISDTLRKSPSEAVVAWLVRHDAELALPTVTKSRSGLRKDALEQEVAHWRRRFADRILGFAEEAALAVARLWSLRHPSGLRHRWNGRFNGRSNFH